MYLVLQFEFDEQAHDARLKVLYEYAKRTNAEAPLPDYLAHVSSVDGHNYTLTTFETQSLATAAESVHDDRFETFNFLQQNLETVPDYAEDEPRVKPHSDDKTKYSIRGDDGWMEIDCPENEQFHAATNACVPIPPCDGLPSGNYPMTEVLIDALVLAHRVPKPNADTVAVHPSIYLRCYEGGSHSVEECPPDHLFDARLRECVLQNNCENRPDGYIVTETSASHALNIDQYLECRNGQINVATCAAGLVFDRRLFQCVPGDPCLINGAGFTFITNDIGDQQYYECVNNQERQLITCFNRIFVNDRFECSGDVECASFADGTGNQLYVHSDDVIEYNEGVLICDRYQLMQNIRCDTTNILENVTFEYRLIAGLQLPRQVYDPASGACVSVSPDLLSVKSDYFSVTNIPNDYGVNLTTSALGKSSVIPQLIQGGDNMDKLLASNLVYARDRDAVGLNAITGQPIECYGARLFDALEGRQINVCRIGENNDDEQQSLQQRLELADNEYIKSNTGTILMDEDYRQGCARRLDEVPGDFVKINHFAVGLFSRILQNDVCHTILNELDAQYTTLFTKYTTPPDKYTTIVDKYTTILADTPNKDVKIETKPTYIERYGSNIHQVYTDFIPPTFEIFEKLETLQPTFNPFEHVTNSNKPNMGIHDNNDNIVNDKFDIHDRNEYIENANYDAARDHDRTPSPPGTPTPRPPPPDSLVLNDKILDYSCYYALPTFKLTECILENERIVQALLELKSDISTDTDCENHTGLANIVNAYAYIGGGVGCVSSYDKTSNRLTVYRTITGPKYQNLDTQSDDNVKYNMYVHRRDNRFVACPEHLLTDSFECNTETNKLYYLEDLQKTQIV